jgi:hypothetical protein
LTTSPESLLEADTEDMATPLRGAQLFGDGPYAASWLALITQRSGEYGLSKKELQNQVILHWHRGAHLLKDAWIDSGQNLEAFVSNLAELAGFTGEGNLPSGGADAVLSPSLTGEVVLPVGEIATDTKTGDPVLFPLNAAGGSPHMAIMGGVGSGKTRTAVQMLASLRKNGEIPLLAFDFKGDLSERLSGSFGATVVNPPQSAIPLDVLHLAQTDDNSIKAAAARIRDSIASVKSKKPSGIQSEALREAVTATLRKAAQGAEITLADVAEALDAEYEERDRKPDELSATLNELTQFDLFKPTHSPIDFFAKSWIIQLPQDGSAELRRLVINMTLDALDRWINSQPDAPTDKDGVRALRHITMLDEAHVILSAKLPALGNLVRMSRSKGGVVMLVSQSPDDFENAEDGYLDNMGLTLAFNTQAKPGPTKRVFGDNTVALSNLPVGEAVCRIRAEARTRRIKAWE